MRYFIYHSRAAADGVVAKPEVRPAPGRWLVPRLGFFLHFLSVSLSLSRVFFCCLLLWRNGPEMQRIGYGDRDRGWDCDWGFTWLQNKLIQNQQETRNEADDKMGHATTETVTETETETETETGAAGGRWQVARHCRRSLRGAARSRWSSSVRPDDNTWVSISISSNTQ